MLNSKSSMLSYERMLENMNVENMNVRENLRMLSR